MAERKGTLGSTPSRPITKRVRGTPTGNTPQQPKKRSSVRGPHAAASRAPVPRRQLSFSGGESTTARQSKLTGKVKVQEWTVEEEMALVDFVHSHGNSWPSTKLPQFWERVAKHLEQTCNTQRTSKCI